MATQVKPQPAQTEFKHGVYFSVDKGLFRIVDISEDSFLVENCKSLDLMWIKKVGVYNSVDSIIAVAGL